MHPIGIVQQAFVIQFQYNGHHCWATCPVCHFVGPEKEAVLAHLQAQHALPGQSYTLVEAKDPCNALSTFWVAVKQFNPTPLPVHAPKQASKPKSGSSPSPKSKKRRT